MLTTGGTQRQQIMWREWRVCLPLVLEKHEPASDIDTVVVDSLKALDPKRPIREADSCAATNGIAMRSPRRQGVGDVTARRGPKPSWLSH